MRILVTGVTGFAGGFLGEALVGHGGEALFGTSRHGSWPVGLEHLSPAISLRPCDLCDREAVESLLRQVSPDRIYHLAGYAHAGQSLHEPDAAWAGNLGATRTLYEAVLRWGGRPRILFIGSGLVYGEPETPGQAFDETSAPRPANPYATSKAAADLVSYQFTRSHGLDIVRVRPFNHFGPRQSPQYAVAHFAEQIAAVERGRRPPVLQTGNLNPLRDLSDVRDMVDAYLLLMERGQTGEAYNVASGVAHSMRSVVDRLLQFAKVPIEVRQKADLVRSRDTAAVCGDAAKTRRETGWSPRFTLEQTLRDTLAYWRQQS